MNFRSKLFVLNGVYALVGIFIAKQLVFQYQNAEMGINLLPVSLFQILLFALAVLVLLLSLFTVRYLAKKNSSPIPFNKRFHLLIPSFVGMIVLYLLMDRNYQEFLVPVALVMYGLILLNMNRFVTSRLLLFGIALIVLGIVAYFFKGSHWFFAMLGFGILPILFGLILLRKGRVPA